MKVNAQTERVYLLMTASGSLLAKLNVTTGVLQIKRDSVLHELDVRALLAQEYPEQIGEMRFRVLSQEATKV